MVSGDRDGSEIGPAAGSYALFLLFCAYTINYVDRQVITILQDPIKRDLGLSDTQLGLLTGLSFALFYAVMGIPMALLADVRSRKRIIVVSMVAWSLMTALCAAARSFAALLTFRIGVGVGEAGLTPAAHSLISDYYPPERRASAMAIYSASGTVGLMVGFLAGGWINEFFGWRAALLVAGVPGLVLAAVIWLTMREPPRGRFDPQPSPTSSPPNKPGASLAVLAGNPAFCCLALACGLHTFVTYGQGNWFPPFLGRVHGMSSGELGTWLAVLSVGPGLLGMVSVGYVADWLAKRRPQARMEVAIGCVALCMPFEAAAVLAEDRYAALAFSAGSFFFAGAYLGPSIAAAYAIIPASVRATASAVILLGVNLIGFGLGPLVTGGLSDYWHDKGLGADSLRYAMLAIIPAQLAAIGLFALAIRLANRSRVAPSA